ELPHPPEVTRGKPHRPRLPAPDVLGQGQDGPLAPGAISELLTDVLADVPVKVDQLLVDGGHGTSPSRIDQAQHLIELDQVRWRRGHRSGKWRFLLRRPAHTGSSVWPKRKLLLGILPGSLGLAWLDGGSPDALMASRCPSLA